MSYTRHATSSAAAGACASPTPNAAGCGMRVLAQSEYAEELPGGGEVAEAAATL